MLFGALSVLALSAITFASPAIRAPSLGFAPTSDGGEVGARGDYDYKDKDYNGTDYKGKDNDCNDCQDYHWPDDKDCLEGYIKLTTYDGKDYGYVGNQLTWYGAYTKASCDDDRLLVKIDESLASSGYFDIWTLNGPYFWRPYLAGIVGFSSTNDDIGKGSYNYFYIGGAAWNTPPKTPAQWVPNTFTDATGITRNVETAIWHSFDKHTKCFEVQWTNCDYSCPETIIGVFDEDCALFGTGDKQQFTDTFGPATWVKLSFEEKH